MVSSEGVDKYEYEDDTSGVVSSGEDGAAGGTGAICAARQLQGVSFGRFD